MIQRFDTDITRNIKTKEDFNKILHKMIQKGNVF